MKISARDEIRSGAPFSFVSLFLFFPLCFSVSSYLSSSLLFSRRLISINCTQNGNLPDRRAIFGVARRAISTFYLSCLAGGITHRHKRAVVVISRARESRDLSLAQYVLDARGLPTPKRRAIAVTRIYEWLCSGGTAGFHSAPRVRAQLLIAIIRIRRQVRAFLSSR